MKGIIFLYSANAGTTLFFHESDTCSARGLKTGVFFPSFSLFIKRKSKNRTKAVMTMGSQLNESFPVFVGSFAIAAPKTPVRGVGDGVGVVVSVALVFWVVSITATTVASVVSEGKEVVSEGSVTAIVSVVVSSAGFGVGVFLGFGVGEGVGVATVTVVVVSVVVVGGVSVGGGGVSVGEGVGVFVGGIGVDVTVGVGVDVGDGVEDGTERINPIPVHD